MKTDVENMLLLECLKASLTDEKKGNAGDIGSCRDWKKGTTIDIDWDKWLLKARKHSVLPLLYPMCETQACPFPETVTSAIQKAAISSAKQSYRLLFLSKFLVNKLREEGIEVAVLKGAATADFYPVPEYRKSGDVDLLLPDRSRLEHCISVLQGCGCMKTESQNALHHVTFRSEDGIEIEIHTLLAEPFDNRKVNHYLENLVAQSATQILEKEIMGITLPVLRDGFHGFELLLHMLQHFLRAGFGLKLLCDWVVFWNREHSAEECDVYRKLVKGCGMKGFSDMVTLTCCRYLGLNQNKVAWMEPDSEPDIEEFLREILEAEEFGRSAPERMVVLRGNNVWDYIREFHHQTRLNFPKIGKIFLSWPVLWLLTFIRFEQNNRKIRNISTKQILGKASQRSKMIQQMKLWKS